MPQDYNIFETYQSMDNDHILLSYKGDISEELLTSVFSIIEVKLASVESETRVRKKVYNIMVECLQNIFKHMEELKIPGDEVPKMNKDAIFTLAHGADKKWYIHTGNFIMASKQEELKIKIEKINVMFPEELRAHYVESLGTTELSEKGGAGLGLIDIARKSGSKLEYKFNQVSDLYAFFSLTVCIA